MRVADYVAELLADLGARHVFMVTGGGAMHLNDAFGRSSRFKNVCCHHEQPCAMAAESYARLCGRPAVLNVTTGPGGVNALNGVFGAYTDSIPMIVVSGQVKRETLSVNYDIPLRQLGDQEVDIIRMVGGITKYAVTVQDPARIRYEVEKAYYIATNGRPGPVWLDIPGDVQGALVDISNLVGFDITSAEAVEALPVSERYITQKKRLKSLAEEVLAKLKTAKRPCLMPGTGVRCSGASDLFLKIAKRLGVPVATAFNAHDLLANDNPLYAGKPGTVGDRAGNFSVQNADFVLVLGCRLNIRQISYNWKSFARAAYKVMVDIDSAELNKPTLNIDLKVHADIKDFLDVLEEVSRDYAPPVAHTEYAKWCRDRVVRYPAALPEYRNASGYINPYSFGETLFRNLTEHDVVVTANATACVVTFQTAVIKQGMRMFSNSGSASMGYDLPAAIGAWYASNSAGRVICLAGDGSIMMNLQELQTIIGNKIPLKLFVLCNSGYHSIRQTQQNFFPDQITGCGPESGVTFPDFSKLGEVFGFSTRRVASYPEIQDAVSATLNGEGAQLCEVFLDKGQQFSPKLSSRRLPDGKMVSSPLEDMAPFLSREELAENMLIPVIQ